MTRRTAARALPAVLALGVARPVAAHAGTTHGGTPHWLLFGGTALGLLAILAGGAAYRRTRRRAAGVVLAAGAVLAVVGAIGLVELQVVGDATPELTEYYEPASIVLGSLVLLGSLVGGRLRWPTRPDYAFLGILLGVWILYPAVLPNGGVSNPFGYLVVASVPALVALILWRDARGVLQSLRLQRTPLVVGAAAGLLFAAFLAFSTGSVTLNPDDGRNLPTEPLVTTMPVTDPLVLWPAVEFVFPDVPFAGYVSVGTLVFFGLLASLVGVNVALIHQQWRATRDGAAGGSFVGMLTATGTTACCCCAPALYGATSVLLGASATPLYWAFMDSSSPLSSGFFALTVVLLTRSIVRAGGGFRQTEGRAPARPVAEDA